MTSNSGLLTQQYVRSRPRPFGANLTRIVPAALLVLVLSVELWVRIESLNTGYRLERLRTEALRNDALLRELTYENATLSSPIRTLERATKELGMLRTAPHQLRRLMVQKAG